MAYKTYLCVLENICCGNCSTFQLHHESMWVYFILLHSYFLREKIEHLLRYGGVTLLSVARNNGSGWCWVCGVRCVARVMPVLWGLYMIRLTYFICETVVSILRHNRFTVNNCWKYAKVYFKYQLAPKNIINAGLAACANEVYTNALFTYLSCLSKTFYREISQC